MRVQYIGMFDEVVVPELDAGRAITRGEVVEVDDELGARMLEQPANWASADAPAKGKGRSSSGPAPDPSR